jgi:Flp pilus assembly protein TadD
MKWIAAAVLATALGMTLAQSPKPGVDAHVGRGSQLMKQQLFDEAAHEFEEALALDVRDARARFEYAVCLLSLGRNDEARQEFERVRKERGESPYTTYYLGQIDLLSNNYASAIKRLSAVAEDKTFPDAPFHLGSAYIASGDVENGIKWLERAVRQQPNEYRVHYRLARAYSTAGRQADATREYALYTKLSNQHKSAEADVRACAEALRGERSTAAQVVCHRLYDPNDPEKLTLLGQLYGEGGAFELALDPLQRAAQLDPKSYEAWHNLGLTYFRLQRYAEARSPLEKAVALHPESYDSLVRYLCPVESLHLVFRRGGKFDGSSLFGGIVARTNTRKIGWLDDGVFWSRYCALFGLVSSHDSNFGLALGVAADRSLRSYRRHSAMGAARITEMAGSIRSCFRGGTGSAQD